MKKVNHLLFFLQKRAGKKKNTTLSVQPSPAEQNLILRLEDRVLFDAAGAAEIVEAAEAANQPDPNAQQSAEEQKAQEDREALKNAPPENPQNAQDSGKAQTDPAEAADVNAQVEQLIQGDLPDAENISVDGDADIPAIDVVNPVSDDISPEDSAFIDGILVDNGDTISTDKELVVINSSVPDQDAILAELKPNQEVLILDEHNGLDEVQEYLDEHADTKYSAIHFVTHGNEGYISINGEIINAENVDPAEWAQIGAHLTDDGDILFYGCDTAKTTEGQQLMNTIADASGADVAASTDATGLAGDWDLEYNVGLVEHEAISVDGAGFSLNNINVTSKADSGAGTFRQALSDAADGDEITFSLGADNTITLSSQLEIAVNRFSTSGITIDGSNTTGDNVILDGNNATRIMNINSGNNVTINNMTFQHGSRAIYNDGALTINDSTFSENSASTGGAIYNDGALTINNSTFSDNSVVCSYGDYGGGAIYNGCYLTINGCTFSGNSVMGFVGATFGCGGGAISNDGLKLTIADTTFSGNTSSYGGAIYTTYLDHDPGAPVTVTATIINCTFSGNTDCAIYQVALSGRGSEVPMNIISSTFSGNGGAVQVTNDPNYPQGGTPGYVQLVNNIFVGDNDSFSFFRAADVSNLYNSTTTVANTFAEVDSTTGKAVLNADGTFHIKFGGSTSGHGVYIWHNEDYSAIAYSTTYDGTKSAVAGSSAEATILSTDQHGTARMAYNTDIGSYLTLQRPVYLTVTGNEKTYDGTALNPAGTAVYKTLPDGLSLTGTATYEIKDSSEATVSSAINAGTYTAAVTGGLSVTGTGSEDYGVVYTDYNNPSSAASATLTINKRDITISGTDTTVTYNGTVQNLSGVSGNNLASGQTISAYTLSTGAKDHADTPYTINVTSAAIQDADSNDVTSNYNVTCGTGNLTIDRKNITVTADAKSKTYGATDPALTYTAAGLIGSDTLSGALTREAGEDAGTYAINQGTITNANNTNYNISYTGANLTITPKEITIDPTSPSQFSYSITAQTYNGDTAVDNATLTMHVDSKDIAINWTNGQFNSKNVADVTTATFTGLVSSDANYAITNSSFTLDATGKILAKDITVTADAKSKTYGDADPALTYTADGLIGSDTLSGSLIREAGENAGTYAILQGTLANSNYNIAYTGANLTITAKEIVIDPTSPSQFSYSITAQTYDGDTAVDNATLTMHVDSKDIAINWTNGQFNSKNVADVSTATFTGLNSSDANYTITNSSFTLDATGKILAKDITVTADAKSKTYGDADPALTYTADGLIGSDTLSGALTREAGENAGTYAILQGTLANTNYNIAYTGANLTITPKNITVVADAKSKTYGDADPALTYTADGLIGSDTLSGNLIREAGENAGTYAITQGSLSGGTNYNITSFTNGTFTITAKEIVIDPTSPSQFSYSITAQTYDGDTAVDNATLTMHVDSKDIAINWTVGQFNSKNVADVSTATFTGLTSSDANYTITNSSFTLDATGKILAKDITVTADAQSKAYGNADPVLTYQVNGLVAGDTLNGNLTREEGEALGTYAILQGTVTNANNTNYNIAYTGAVLTITMKEIVIDPTNPSQFSYSITAQTYDGDTAVDNATLTMHVDGKDIAINWTNGQFNSRNVADVSTATFTGLVSSDANYTIKNSSLTLDAAGKILAKDITVVADAQSKAYGDADPELTYTATGLIGSDTLSGNLIREAGENAGTYAINQGTLANSNYNIAYTGANLTITPKEIVIDPTSPSQFTYDITAQTYDGDTAVDNATLTMHVDSKDIAINWTVGQFNSRNVVDVSTATFTGLTSSDANYTITNSSFTLDATGKILAKDITVTADAKSKTYGDADPALTYTADGLIGSDTLSGALTREAGENAGTYAILQGTLANSNYNIAYTGANLTITPKEIVIDPTNPSQFTYDITAQTYDGDTAVDNATLTMHVDSKDIAINWTVGQFNSRNVVDVSTATFTGLVSSDGNYAVTNNSFILNAAGKITAKDITVVADAKSKTYGDADPALTYTADGLIGSDTLSGSLIREAGENAGTYAILQGTLANSNYHIASYTGANLTITPKEIVIDPTNPSQFTYDITAQTYDGDTAVDNATLTMHVDSKDIAINWTVGQFNSRNVVDVSTATFTGLVSSDGNYAVTNNSFILNAAGKITAKDITVVADAKSKTCGATDPVLTYLAEGIVAGETLNGELIRESGEKIGTYQILQGSIQNENNTNYNISYIGAAFVITDNQGGVNSDCYSDGLNRNFSCTMAALEGDYLADSRKNLIVPYAASYIEHVFSQERRTDYLEFSRIDVRLSQPECPEMTIDNLSSTVSSFLSIGTESVKSFATGDELLFDDQTSFAMPSQGIRIPGSIFADEPAVNMEAIMSLKETLHKNKNFESDFEKLLDEVELYA